MRFVPLVLAFLLSGCALAPLVIEKLVTVGVGAWGVQQHRERQKEMEAIQDRVDQLARVTMDGEMPP